MEAPVISIVPAHLLWCHGCRKYFGATMPWVHFLIRGDDIEEQVESCDCDSHDGCELCCGPRMQPWLMSGGDVLCNDCVQDRLFAGHHKLAQKGRRIVRVLIQGDLKNAVTVTDANFDPYLDRD